MRWLLLVGVFVAAAILFISRGPDELRIFLDRDDMAFLGFEPPQSDARTFEVAVELGCEGEDLEDDIEGYDLEESEDRVVVTFKGKESDSQSDCGYRVVRSVELERPLGQRRICDGSTDPPEELWGPGRPVPNPPATRSRYPCGEIDADWPGFEKACGGIYTPDKSLELDITAGYGSVTCRQARDVMAEFLRLQPSEQETATFLYGGKRWSCYVARPDGLGWDFHCSQDRRVKRTTAEQFVEIAAGRRQQSSE